MFFTQDRLKYDLSALVEFIARALYDTNKTFVRHSTFSLVNVTSPIAGLSCGLANAPHPTLRRFHPVSFTFAFTTRDTYDGSQRPRFSMRPYPNTTMWGNTLVGNSDFLTVSVPKQVMRDVGLLVPNLREMKWLYMAIGAWSKGFAKQFSFYTHKGSYHTDPIDPHMAYSKYYYAHLQKVFKRVEYDKWCYSKDVWMLAPNFISPRSVTPDFLEYYCLYLAKDFYGKYRCANVEQIERKVEEFVESGVLDAMSLLSNNEAYNPSLVGDSSRSLRAVMELLGGDISPLQYVNNVQEAVKTLLAGRLGRQP